MPWLAALFGGGAAAGGAGAAAAGGAEAAGAAGAADAAAAAAAPAAAEAAGATGAGASMLGTGGAGASMDVGGAAGAAAPSATLAPSATMSAAAPAAGATGGMAPSAGLIQGPMGDLTGGMGQSAGLMPSGGGMMNFAPVNHVPLAGANAIASGTPDATAGMGAGSVSTPGPWASGYQFPTGPSFPTPGSAVDGATTGSDAGSTTGASDSSIWQSLYKGLNKGANYINKYTGAGAEDPNDPNSANPILKLLAQQMKGGQQQKATPLNPPTPMHFTATNRPQPQIPDPLQQQLAMMQAFNLQG